MFKNELFALRDEWYKSFQCKLMPTVSKSLVIGIRTPALRNFARQIKDSAKAKEFLALLPHKFYEENNLHGFLIEFIRDYDECVAELDRFLPFVDNWTTCDSLNPKVLGKYPDRLITDIGRWLAADDIYTVRFGLKALMSHFLDENFKAEYLDLAAETPTEEYYLSMMTAWFFATALAKQYDAALPFLTERKLDKATHNRAIQKAVESYRITDEQKRFLRGLKY
ncbi:MAG: DNA alkylation repair protein [Clostridia bacterium]|nr:DNA alkylation repair protein [Clostridia bacterium]